MNLGSHPHVVWKISTCSAGRVVVNLSIDPSLFKICQGVDDPSTAIVRCTLCRHFAAAYTRPHRNQEDLCNLIWCVPQNPLLYICCMTVLHSTCSYMILYVLEEPSQFFLLSFWCMVCVPNMVSLHWQRLNCWRPVCWQLKNSRSSKKQLLEWRFNRMPLISRSDFSWRCTCDGLCQKWWRGILNRSTIFRVVKLLVTITTISVDFNCNIVVYMLVLYIDIGWYWCICSIFRNWFETLRCLLCYGMSYFGQDIQGE